jgi:glycosyltransferase involved in cell wall biosynthesis
MKGYDLIWIRDVSVSLIISEKLNKISHVLELHSTPDINKLIKIQRSLGGKLVLAPINEHLMHSIDSPKLICKKILAPMSIDLKLLETKVGIADYIKSIKQKASAGNLKLGYVGKFSPIGYSKGIQDLIELGKLLPSHLMGWEIVIAGGLQSEIENLNWSFVDSMQQNNNIKLLGHFTHTKAIELMRNIDIHVIPAPQSSKYVGTPLKLREIIALGKIVIAADCQVLRNCFPGKYQPYWYEPQDATSLLVAIQTAIADPEKLRNITNGVKEVSQFTWDSRVKLILNCIHLE